jgi:WD40 repeat protein
VTEYRSVLERAGSKAPPPDLQLERVLRRRDRKRRNQRVAAGVVGIAVFVAAVWIVTSVGSLDRTQPAVTGPTIPPEPGVSEVDYMIDLDTGVMTPLPEGIVRSLGVRWVNQYAVSPDGSRLAYVGDDSPDPGPQRVRDDQIFIAGIDGIGVRQVTHAANGAWSPAWSPDGARIAYEAIDSGHQVGLYVLDVASGESTRITGVNADYRRCVPVLHPGGCAANSASPLEPQFTPNGSSLVYTGGSNGQTVISIVPVAGGESTLLIDPGRNLSAAENGSLSPDGSLVTFLGSRIGSPGQRRWVAGTDGTERRLLPDLYGIPCWSTPAGTWSPDGNRIVCSEGSKVIVLDIATGAATPVAYGRQAIWLDDHTLLVSV